VNNEALNEFVKFMTEALKQAKDFTLAQAPEVMKEIIRMTVVKSGLGVAMACLGVFACYRAHLGLQKKMEEKPYGMADICYVPLGFAAIVCVIMIFCFGDDLITATIAPRVYLIEYFSHLVKK